MRKQYPNLSINQFDYSIASEILIEGVFKRIVLFMLFYMCTTTISVSAQCNTEGSLPLVSGSYDNLTTSSSTTGLCVLGCGISNVSNLIDADLTNFATATTGIGLGITHKLKVSDGNTIYASGTFAGYRIAPSSGLLSADLLNSISIKTYLGNTLRETLSGDSLLSLSLLSNAGSYIVGFNTSLSFDTVEITINSLAGVATSTDIYYAVIRNYCAGPQLDCNVATAINLPVFPVDIEASHTGLSGINVGSISNAQNVISSNTTDYGTINLTAGLLASGSIAVKDQLTDYPVGTYAGFEIQNSNLLSVSALGNVHIITYLNGVQQDDFTGNNLVVNGSLLNNSGRYKVGFVSAKAFDEVQVSIQQPVGLSLGSTRVYGAVFESFCAGPDLVCNTQTGMSAPTYPVYINGEHTGIDAVACVACSVNDTENLIDQDTSNYAQINLTIGAVASGSISVKDQITDYPIGSFVGFTLENPSLLNVNALDAVTITTYLNGLPQEIKFGNSALATVGTNLLASNSIYTIGFIATKAFDEARITIANTVAVNLGIVNVYNAVFQKLCPVTLECNKTYTLTNPTFPVIIDSNKTGVDGVACVACAVNNTNNVLTASTTDYATILVTAGVIAPASIAVLDQLSTYPVGTYAGFTIKDLNSLVQLDLFSSLTISTYLDGVWRESKSASDLLNLSLLTPFGSGADIYNVGFQASLTFDEIRISVGSLASVINDINVYGAFVNTASTSGGTLFCAVIDAVDDSFSPIVGSAGSTNAGNVLTNDTINGNPVAINDIDLTVSNPAVPMTPGAPVPSIDPLTGIVTVPVGTPAGSYSITYQICYKLNPLICDSATVTVVVTAAVIDAVSDTTSPINGLTGSTNAGNVLTNDTLNGGAVTNGNVNLTITTPATPIAGGPVPSVDVATGIISIPTSTPAGNYTITYQICEKLNPSNCDTATVTVTVTAPAILANDDITSINGYTGGTAPVNVLTNDTLNGNPVNPSEVTLTSTPNGPLTVNTDGSITVAPNTPAGTYTVTYQICEILNPSNCDTATVTVTVTAPAILANDDTTSINGYTGGTAPVNVLTNDTLNGNPVNPSEVTLTSTPNGPLTVNTDGSITVAPNTPAGTYTITYQICEILNPLNCDTATVTVTVTAPVILANDDTTSINGYTGGTAPVNVLTNDTLNGNPVNPSEVTLTSTPNGPLTVNTDGSITVVPNTPAGTYTVTYQICEKLNPSNCDMATVTVTVTSPVILANDDTATVNGYTGGTPSVNVLTNDTLNGNPVNPSEVTLTSTPNGPLTVNTDGSITVVPNTPAGTYTVTYQICEKLNPSNCDMATVTVTVTSPVILANDDTGDTVGTLTGGTAFINVLGNDTLNGFVVNSSQVSTTFVSSTNPGITLSGTDVVVAAGTPVGNYTLTYQICENLNPTNCDSAVVNVIVASNAPTILANNDTGIPVNGYVGGTAFTNVLVNDTLNGAPATISNVDISFVSSTLLGITLSGTDVIVAAGTPAGTYSLDYQICEKAAPSNCDVARVTVTVVAAVIEANDDAGTNINGNSGGTAFTNVLGNDTLNSAAVTSSQVNTTFVSSTNSGIILSGTDVMVLAGTQAGSYSLTYQICEKLNPSNCDTATVTVTVTAPVIFANDDTTSINGYTGGTAPVNVLTNDTLNGIPVNPSEVTLSSTPNGPLTVNAGGTITVAPNTPAGTYTVSYQICETLNPSNCDMATVTVTVTAPVILANDDTTSINGYTGGTAPVNVLTNDTLNGIPVNPSEVTLTSTPNGPLTVNAGGSITVVPNTPAGTYTVNYQICETLNPSNCDMATVTVTVTAPVILANDDTTSINGYTGGIAPVNVLTNDTLNGNPVNPSEVTLSSTPNGPLTVNAGGTITVAPNTPAGTYTVSYQICETLNPSNCDTATVTLTVTAPVILANDDTTSINGYTGGTAPVNVLTNDTLNGIPVNPSEVTLSSTSNGPLTVNAGGTITVAPNTPAGTYTVTYQICETLNPSNCDTATVTVTVTAPVILANDDIGTAVSSYTGGTAFANVLVNDTLNGTVVSSSQVNTTFVSSTNSGITLSGADVIVAAGTPAGTYSLDYQICEKLNPTNCDVARVSIVVTAAPIDAVNDTNTTPVYGVTGGNTGINVFTNDTLNGNPLNPSNVVLTSVSNGPLTVNTNGNVTVAPNTAGGTYTVNYTICEVLNPTNCDTATVTVFVSSPSIALVKTSAVGGTGAVGDIITYTFTVTNTGNTTLNNIIINDVLTNSVNLAVTPSTLAPSEIATATVTYVIKQSDIDAGKVTNSATVTGTIPTGGTVTDISGTTIANDISTVTTLTSSPGIAVVKTSAVGGTVKVGDLVTYTFTVTNTGNTTLSNIIINDALTNSVNMAVTPSVLIPNAVGVATATYVIKQSDIDAGRVTNSATVTGTIPTGGTITDTSGSTITNDNPTVTTLNMVSGISITKEGTYVDKNGDGVANIGDVINYSFTITNTGNVSLSNIAIRDDNVPTVRGNLNSLSAGATDSVTFTAEYSITNADIEKGYVYNSAIISAISSANTTVTAVSTDTTPCTLCPILTSCLTCTITAIPQTPSIAIVKKATFKDENGDGYAEIGETIDYTFMVMNTGNLPLTNVTLTDALPGIVITGGPISLAVGATDSATFSGIYHITQQDIVKGSVSNQAMIKGMTPTGGEVVDMSDDESPLEDDPTVLGIDGCSLEVFNAVSPDGDGLNDILRIRGIECYPKNTVQIFNRWGVKVYEAEGYNNDTVAFKGLSEGRVTVNKSEGLPSGTYFYIVKYEDFSGTGIDKSGYLNISRE